LQFNPSRSLFFLILLGLSPQLFAAADILYDFGAQQHHPKVTSTNPALLSHCQPQVMTGFSIRKLEFEVENQGVANANLDKSKNYGSIDFGMCNRLFRWLTYGIHVNANALSFRFETQNQNDPIVFPYGKDTLPIGSGGIGLKVTEPLSLGFAWKMVERVDVAARIPITGFELQADIDVDVRPVLSWLLGGSYRTGRLEWYYSYSPEIRGDLDFAFDINLDLPFVVYDLGLVEMQTAISYIPAQNRFGVLGQIKGIHFDLGVVQSQWRKFDDPFLNIDAFGNVDALFFNRRQLSFQDTLEPYLVLSHQLSNTQTLSLGYSYRRNPIKENPQNEPLIGADLHSVKVGFERQLDLFQKKFTIGGDLVVGFMNGAQETSPTQRLDGYFTNIQGYLKVPLDAAL